MIDTKTKFIATSALLIMASSFLFLTNSVQAVKKLDISAYILNNKNKEIANGEYDIRFAIYTKDRTTTDGYPSNSDSGSRVWEETQKVKIENGSISAFLGEKTPLPNDLNFSSSDYYVGIRINTDSEMVPRKKIGAVPLASDSYSVGGATLGTQAGNLVQLAKGGKLDAKILPSITTLGVVANGTWEADVVATGFGGTGLTNYAKGDTLYASASNKLASMKIGTNGQVLSVVNGLPAWQELLSSQSISNDDDALVIADSNADGMGDIFFRIANSDKMVILNNGNVGIGVANPAYTLDVAGTINASSLIINGEATLGVSGEDVTLNSSLIPSTTGLNLGSASNHWSSLYVDNMSVGGTDLNGTTSEYFTINSDSTVDETMGLRFYRSSLNGYATLTWDAIASRFNLFQRENTSELGNLNVGSITAQGVIFMPTANALAMGPGTSLRLWDNGVNSYIVSNDDTNRDLIIQTGANKKVTMDGGLSVNGLVSQTGLGNSTYFGENAGINDDLLMSYYNVGVGYDALYANTSGYYNSAVGADALFNNTIGYNNVAVGRNASYSNTTGFNNSAIGGNAMYSNTTGSWNVAMGSASLYNNTTGSYNSSFGMGSLTANTTGHSNVAVGSSSMYRNITGYNNSAVGLNALHNNTTGIWNTVIGSSALYANTLGNSNSAFGTVALSANTTGSANSAIGVSALGSNVTGDNNTSIGFQSGYSNLTGSSNVFLGAYAGFNETGSNKLYITNSATSTPLIHGDFSTSILTFNGRVNQSNLAGSTYFGEDAGRVDDLSNNENAGFGYVALSSNTYGDYNSAIGFQALMRNTTGNRNSAIGRQALYANTTGNGNSAVGEQALYSNSTGIYNVALGVQSLQSNTTGEGNSAVGLQSLYRNTSGIYNSAIGMFTLYSNTTGWANTAIGYQAGYSNSSGLRNVFIGYNAGYAETGSDKLYIENSNISNPLIYGDFATDILAVNGKLGIGTNSPTNILSLNNTAAQKIWIEDTVSGTVGRALTMAAGSTVAGGTNIVGGNLILQSGLGTGTGASTISFQTGTTLTTGTTLQTMSTKMTILGNGNVGIGMTNPNNLLQVTGLVNFDNTRYSTSLGYQAGNVNAANYNTFVGHQAGRLNSSGSLNSAVGSNALQGNTSGGTNTAMGQSALSSNSTGSNNVSFGGQSLIYANASGNSAIGAFALQNTVGGNNTGVGMQVLNTNTGGANNVALGYQAGFSGSGSNNVFLGYQAGYSEIGSNKLYIDNSNISDPLIYGDFATNALTFNGDVGIGVNNPAEALDINGRLRLAQLSAPGTTTDKLYNVSGDLYWNGGVVNKKIYTLTPANDSAQGGNGTDPYIIGTNGEDILIVDGTNLTGNAYLTLDETTPTKQIDVRPTNVPNKVYIWHDQTSTMSWNGSSYALTAWSGKDGLSIDGGGGKSVQLIGVSTATGTKWSTPSSNLKSHVSIDWQGGFDVNDGYEERYSLDSIGYTKVNSNTFDTMSINSSNPYLSFQQSGIESAHIDFTTGMWIGANGANDVTLFNSGGTLNLKSNGNVDATGQVTATDGFIHPTNAGACSDALFTTDTDGQICLDSSGGAQSLYFRTGGTWSYIAKTGGFQIPNYEVAPANQLSKNVLRGITSNELTHFEDYLTQQIVPGELLIPYADSTLQNGAIHGLYARFADVKDQMFQEEKTQIENLNLQVTGNITTVAELKNSINTQLGSIEKNLTTITNDQETNIKQISNINAQITNSETKITTLETLAITLQQQITQLQSQIATPVNIAQIDANTQSIDYLNQLLGITPTSKAGDITIVGKFTSKITETGAMIIVVNDKTAATIGETTIKAGDTSVTVNTTSVSADSKVFVTSEKPVEIGVNTIKKGESFKIEIGKVLLEDLQINWWIVDKK